MLQYIPAMELISMFIRLETRVRLSGGNWQQLWKLYGIESNEIKCGKSGLSCSSIPAADSTLMTCVCVFVLTVLQNTKQTFA